MVINNYRERSGPRSLGLFGGIVIIVSGAAGTTAMYTAEADPAVGFFFREPAIGFAVTAGLGLFVVGLGARDPAGVVNVGLGLLSGVVAGVTAILCWTLRNWPGQPKIALVLAMVAIAGASLVGIAGISKVARERADEGAARPPGLYRVPAFVAGLAMALGPFFRWRWFRDAETGEIYGIERGIDSTIEGFLGRDNGTWTPILGWIVVVAGAVTLILVFVPRLLPLAIATGAVAGAITVLYLFRFGQFVPLPHVVLYNIGFGLVVAMGGAALAGAAGFGALAVHIAARDGKRNRLVATS